MKMRQRLFPLLLCLALFCGCGRREEKATGEANIVPVAPQTATPKETTPSPMTEQERTQRVFVRYAEEEKDYRAETGNALLLTYRCRTPVVELPGLDKQEGRINTALASLSESFRKGAADAEDSGLEALLSTVAYHYAQWSAEDPTAEFLPYAYERDGSVVRGDGTVVSLLFSDYIFSGGVHGGTAWSGICFDTETGERLTLTQLSEDPDALRDTCLTQIRSQCDAMKDMLFDDYADHIEELYCDGLWYLNDSGLVFIANEYHLAPYAAGTLTFTIRYKTLRGVMSERYFLPDRSDVQGGLEAYRQSDLNLGKTKPKVEVKLDDVGESIVLLSTNSVYNIRIFSVSYEENSGNFFREQEQVYLSSLHNGEYFTLQSSIPDVVPNLQLSWRLPDGSSQRYLISQSGEDGSILLIEPNILSRIQPGSITSFPFFWDLNGDGVGEYLQLAMDGVWKLQVNDGEIAMPFEGDLPKLFAADVDEDECCELFAESGNTLCCYRYKEALENVDFILKGVNVAWLNATVLDVSSDGLHISCNIPLFDTKLPAQAVFRDGADGALALAYGSEWDFFTHGSLTLPKEIAYTAADGSEKKLPAGAAIIPVTMNDEILTFTMDSGEQGTTKIEVLNP